MEATDSTQDGSDRKDRLRTGRSVLFQTFWDSVALLVLVVVVVAILFIRNRPPRYCNESSAIGNVRTVYYVQTDYKEANGVYARSFAELMDTSKGSAFLLGVWDGVTPKSGYIITLESSDNGNCYEIKASPTGTNPRDKRHFYTDCSGVIRASADGPADSKSTPIGE